MGIGWKITSFQSPAIGRDTSTRPGCSQPIHPGVEPLQEVHIHNLTGQRVPASLHQNKCWDRFGHFVDLMGFCREHVLRQSSPLWDFSLGGAEHSFLLKARWENMLHMQLSLQSFLVLTLCFACFPSVYSPVEVIWKVLGSKPWVCRAPAAHTGVIPLLLVCQDSGGGLRGEKTHRQMSANFSLFPNSPSPHYSFLKSWIVMMVTHCKPLPHWVGEN